MQGFKIGDRVVCNNSTNTTHVTSGKVYTVVGFDPFDIHLDIINDSGKLQLYIPSVFTVLNNQEV